MLHRTLKSKEELQQADAEVRETEFIDPLSEYGVDLQVCNATHFTI